LSDQQLPCRLLAIDIDKAPKPLLHLVIGVEKLARHARREIRQLLGMVSEGMPLRGFVDLKIRGIFRRMVQPNGGLDVNECARSVKVEQRNAIPEKIVNPSDL
jgi:hypothetical protein